MRMLATALAVGLMLTGCASNRTVGGAAGPGTSESGSGWTSWQDLGSASNGSSGSGSASGALSSVQPSLSPPVSPVSPVDSRCPAQLDEGQHNAADGKPVPDDIAVAWVLRCRVVPQPGGTRYLLVERSDSDPSRLLAALRTPDQPLSKGACPAIAMVVPYFVLVKGDGSSLLPHIPVTDCRLPQPPVLQAFNALQFQVIARHRLP